MVDNPEIIPLDKIEQIIYDTIIPEMRAAGYASGVPEEFIKHIKVRKVSDRHYCIFNDWTDDTGKKPLALWFEHGTKRHWVQPKDPDGVLAWPSGGPESGSSRARFSKRFDNTKNNMLFSKGHWIDPIPPYGSMGFGWKQGLPKLKNAIQQMKV